MESTKKIILFLACLVSLAGYAQTTVQPDTIQADTLKQQETIVAGFDEDDLLLQMIAKQSREIYVQDSLRQDSLLARQKQERDSLVAALLQQDSALSAQLKFIHDTLNVLLAEERQAQRRQDSLTRLAQRQDSVGKKIVLAPAVINSTLTPSLVHDPQEDANEMKRMQRYIVSPWRYDATVQIQFAQNYTSKNWYQGGNKFNFNLLTLLKGNVIYSKNNMLWENMGEWRSGFANAPADTIHGYNVTDDLFRIYSKFGYQIAKNLYASGSAEIKTNLWDTWVANSETTVKSTFLTPLRYSMDVGLDYKPVNGLSIMLSPASYKLVYAYDTQRVAATSFGIDEGKQILNQIGSSVRVKWHWQPIREIILDTEFYLYTNYKKVEIDWQTDCNFIINRFLSTRISLHPRFDNTVLTDGKAKLQFKEVLSVGFTHKFN